jgi:putative membrane protein
MTRWLIHWAIATVALMALPYLFNGITINEPMTALMAALVLGLINTFIKPVVSLLTLPLQILSLGLVTLLINAGLLFLVSSLVKGFHIDTFGTAFWAAIVYGLINWAVSSMLANDKK